LPPPPDWAGIGAPEAVPPERDLSKPILLDKPVRRAPLDAKPIIRTLDERAFMQECADRLNGFLATYPKEAQHVLRTFVKYEHEMVEVHRALQARSRLRLLRSSRGQPLVPDLEEELPDPGVTFAALFGAVLQTHHGTGWYLRPVLIPDPDEGVGQTLIVRFEVVRQEEEGEGAT